MLSRAHKYCWVFIIAALAAMLRFAGTESITAHTPTTLPVEPPELVLQTGHSEKINSIAFSPDHRLLASGSSDYSVALWDLASGHELRRLVGHANWVKCVAFSPDGKLLASGSNDKSIKLWDVVTGRELRTFSGHDAPVESIAFSSDGRWLASGSSDNTARVWEVATGSFRPFKDHTGWVTSVVFSPDGKWLATGSRDKTIQIWDLNSNRPARNPLRGHGDLIKALAFSPDGQWLASGSFDGTVRIWKTSTGKEVRSLPGGTKGDNSCMAQSTAGNNPPCIIALAFVDGGREFLSANSKKVVSLWETPTGRALRSTGDNKSLDLIESAAFAPDGRSLAVGADNAIEVYEVASGRKVKTLDSRTAGLEAIAFSANGRWLALGGKDKAIHLWDIASGRQLPRLVGHTGYVTSIALSQDGRYLASGSVDHTIRVWDTSLGREIRRLDGHEDMVNAVAFSPDDHWLASGGYDRIVRIWDTRSWEPERKLQGHLAEITTVAFSFDGRLLASGGVDKTIRIWDTTTWAEPRILNLSSKIEAVVFSPDNTLLAVGAGDTIKLFDVSSGSEIRALQADQGLIRGLAFSPDAQRLASACNDKTIRLWNLSGPLTPRLLHGHSDSVSAVTFSPDGRSLASSSEDGSALVWDFESGKQIATLISLRDGDEWLAVTPEGLFDGSPAAWDQILWRFGGNTSDFAPVEVFFNEFFYPSLVADIISGKKPHAQRDISEKDRRQPTVRLEPEAQANQSETIGTRNIEIKIEITEAPPDKDHTAGSGVRDVRLFRNGSLVKVWHGDLNLNQAGKAELEWSVPIVAGKNILTAYAFNRDNIKSNNATRALTGDEKLRHAGTVYVVVAGVNQYTNAQYNLLYAVPDADDFGKELRRAQLKLGSFADIQVVPLFDSEATKANLMLALRRFVESDDAALATAPEVLKKIKPAQPEDVVVIYFAGHGTAQKDSFYLIPHDLGYSGPRDELDRDGLQKILEHSISDRELEKALEQIDAGRFLLVIDACNSGQALEAEEKRRGPMNSKGLPQLAYEKGMFILTAAQSYQAAKERRSLGHGYLTYALVEEGLKTDLADARPNDGKVTLEEWLDYAVGRVPQMQAGTATDTQGRLLEHEKENQTGKKKEREVQRPRVFYRVGLEANQLIVARTESK